MTVYCLRCVQSLLLLSLLYYNYCNYYDTYAFSEFLLCYSHETTWHHEHQHFFSPFKFLKWICGKNKIAYRSSFLGRTHPHQVATPKIYDAFPCDTMSDQMTTVGNPVYSLFYWNLSCLLQTHWFFCCCCFSDKLSLHNPSSFYVGNLKTYNEI